ncbi:11229_t:CDS:1, partial [Ambispora leptoticha]
PLIPNQNGYNRASYLAEINNSIDQVQRLLYLILAEQVHLTIILRLIRLLVLIGLNESTSASKVFNTFKYWDKTLRDKIFSSKLMKYLNENYMGRLAITLHNDLKETGCDSLVILHYPWEGMSKFSNLEQYGIVKLKYTSVEQFHSALRDIIAPIATEESDASDISIKQFPDNRKQQNNVLTPTAFMNEHDQNSEKLEISKETPQESATEIQAWFRQIHDSSEAKESAIKIQVWFR